MSKKIKMADLEELQALVVKSLKTRIEFDLEGDVPTDAATLGVVVKLLKDNAVTADPADREDLNDLRSKLTEAEQARKARAQQRRDNVMQLVASDQLKAG